MIFNKISLNFMGKNWMCNKYSWKTDPSEIERTYNIRKQQPRFY